MYQTPPPKEATEPKEEESPDSLLLTPESKVSSRNAPTAMVDKFDPTVGKSAPTTVPVPPKAVAPKTAGVPVPTAASNVPAPTHKSAGVPKEIVASGNVTEGSTVDDSLSVASSGDLKSRRQAFAADRPRLDLSFLRQYHAESSQKLTNIELTGLENKAIAENNALGIQSNGNLILSNGKELQKLRKLYEQQLHELKIANMASDRTKYKEALVLIQRYERQMAILNKRLEALEAAQPLKDRSNAPPLPPRSGPASSIKVDSIGGARAGKAVKTHIGLRSTSSKQAAQKTKKERSSTVVVKSPPP